MHTNVYRIHIRLFGIVFYQVKCSSREEKETNMNSNIEKVSRQYISSEVRFYTIADLVKMLGWSEMTVQKLFNDPKFPSSDFGRSKVIEAHALIDYFSKRHEKRRDRYWA